MKFFLALRALPSRPYSLHSSHTSPRAVSGRSQTRFSLGPFNSLLCLLGELFPRYPHSSSITSFKTIDMDLPGEASPGNKLNSTPLPHHSCLPSLPYLFFCSLSHLTRTHALGYYDLLTSQIGNNPSMVCLYHRHRHHHPCSDMVHNLGTPHCSYSHVCLLHNTRSSSRVWPSAVPAPCPPDQDRDEQNKGPQECLVNETRRPFSGAKIR